MFLIVCGVSSLAGAGLFSLLFLGENNAALRTRLEVNGIRVRPQDERTVANILVPCIGALTGCFVGVCVYTAMRLLQ